MRLRPLGIATTVVAVALAALTWPDLTANLARTRGDDFPAAARALAELAVAALAAWVLLVVLAGATHRRPPAPAAVRVLLFVGAVVAAPSAAHADSSHDLDGLPLPDRPEIAAAALPTAVPPVTVAPGDTLWAIATDALGGEPSAAAVASAVGAWHAANRSVIGDDPDLIHPGQVLTPPAQPEES